MIGDIPVKNPLHRISPFIKQSSEIKNLSSLLIANSLALNQVNLLPGAGRLIRSISFTKFWNSGISDFDS